MNFLYEINTRVWLKSLSEKYGREIQLSTVPEEELRQLKELGFDAVWLMGIWRASEEGRQIAREHAGLRQEFLNALPDVELEDIVSSPYAVAGYETDPSLGGTEGLMEFKKLAHQSGLKVILDFVPNHVANDHPWVKAHPEYFVNGTRQDLQNDPNTFFLSEKKDVLAHGKDPYFPAWTDVAQLNYFNLQTRQAMQEELLKISYFCDGVRCDMAMLVLKGIQRQVWGDRIFNGGQFKEPAHEFWSDAVVAVKKVNPDFIFIAEVYWGLESELVSSGFDYVYDKAFYEALKDLRVDEIRGNLFDAGELAKKRLKFIENHDEGRAATVFGIERSKAAVLLLCLAPGGHLFYQGQLEGLRKRLPVQLIRQPKEEVERALASFYQRIFKNLQILNTADSRWEIWQTHPAWEGNGTFRNVIICCKQNQHLAVINYSGEPAQCYVAMNLGQERSQRIVFKDVLGSEEYTRDSEKALYFDLPAFGCHLFQINTSQ